MHCSWISSVTSRFLLVPTGDLSGLWLNGTLGSSGALPVSTGALSVCCTLGFILCTFAYRVFVRSPRPPCDASWNYRHAIRADIKKVTWLLYPLTSYNHNT